MPNASPEARRRLESLDPADLAAHQLARLNALLAEILPANAFYASKFASIGLPPPSHRSVNSPSCPTRSRKNCSVRRAGADGPRISRWSAANAYRCAITRRRAHAGWPLAVLDTADDWEWWMDCWNHILDAAGVTHQDVAFFAFSFGPFVGFWSAHDATLARGCQVVPGGGMNTVGRLDLLRTTESTIVFCTPSYALHMAETCA